MSEKLSFEEAMTRLEEISRLLERGDTPLEQALSLFEESAKLLKQCGKLLENAEAKVSLITKAGEEPETQQFDADE